MRTLFSRLVIGLLLLTVSACTDLASLRDLSDVKGFVGGRVYKGLVTNATVSAYELTAGRTKGPLIAAFTTDSLDEGALEKALPAGAFAINVSAYEGDILLEVGGETAEFTDEATGLIARFPQAVSFGAIVPAFDLNGNRQIIISPMTEFTRRMMACPNLKDRPTEEAHSEAVAYVQQVFKIKDFESTEPFDLTAKKATSLTEDVLFGLALATMSQDSMRKFGATTVSVLAYVEAVASDFEDCVANGRKGEEPVLINGLPMGDDFYGSNFASAVVEWSENPNNKSELTADVLKDYIDALNGTLKNVFAGTAFLGAIRGADVSVYTVDDSGAKGTLLGTALTTDGGAWRVETDAYKGNVLVQVERGVYLEESNGLAVTMETGQPLRTVLTAVDFGDTADNVAVGAASEFAYRRLACEAGLYTTRWDLAKAWVANRWGLAGFDRVRPVDLTLEQPGATITPALKVGLFNAALSALAADIAAVSGLPVEDNLTAIDLVHRFGNDIGDCSGDGMDGTGATAEGAYIFSAASSRHELGMAVQAWLSTDRNASGLSYSDVRSVIAVFEGAVQGTPRGEVFKGLAQNYDIVAQSYHNWFFGNTIFSAPATAAYTLEIRDYYGPLFVAAKGQGATYYDEASQQNVAFGNNELRMMVPYFYNGDHLRHTISPLTDWTWNLARCYQATGAFPDSQVYNQAYARIAAHFGVSGFESIAPANLAVSQPVGAALTNSQKLALVLAGISRLAQNINATAATPVELTSLDVVRVLGQDVSDCQFDGSEFGAPLTHGSYTFSSYTVRNELAQAMFDFLESGANGSGLHSTLGLPLYKAISDDNSLLFPSDELPVAWDDVAPVITFNRTSGAWVKGTVAFSASGSDVSGMYSLAITSPASVIGMPSDGSSISTQFREIDTTTLPTGPTTIWVRAEDVYHNVRVVPFVLNVDNTAPDLVLPADFTTCNDVGEGTGPGLCRPTNSKFFYNLTGALSSPSGVTWFTVTSSAITDAAQVVGYSGTWPAAQSYAAALTLDVEGPQTFTFLLASGVGTLTVKTLNIIRDTTPPSIVMPARTHVPGDGLANVAYNDSTLQSGVAFHAPYGCPGAECKYKFEYPNSLLTVDVTDAYSDVSTITKELYKNSLLVTPVDSNVTSLSLSAIGNDFNLSKASGGETTTWHLVVKACDSLGNCVNNQQGADYHTPEFNSGKRYYWIMRVFAPKLTLQSSFRGGCSTLNAGGAFLHSYYYNCPEGQRLAYPIPTHQLKNGSSNWINGKLSVMRLQFKNEAGVPVYWSAAAYSDDYLKTLLYRDTRRTNWDMLAGTTTSNGYNCNATYPDYVFTSAGVFSSCTARGVGDAYSETQAPSFSSLTLASYVANYVSGTGYVTKAAVSGSTYLLQPGEVVYFFLQMPALSGLYFPDTELLGGTATGWYYGNLVSYWGDYRGYTAPNYNFNLYKRSNVATKFEMTTFLDPDKTYRYDVATAHESTLKRESDSGIGFPDLYTEGFALVSRPKP